MKENFKMKCVRETKGKRKTELQSDLCSQRNEIITTLNTICKSEIYSDFSGKKGTKFCNSHRKNIFSESQLFKWKLSDQE